MKKTKKTEAKIKKTVAGTIRYKRARTTGGEGKPQRRSALDSAAQILAKAGKPMHAPALITAMAEQGLWTSPAGRTPARTLSAAIHREIATKGSAARFKKVDRGQFRFNS